MIKKVRKLVILEQDLKEGVKMKKEETADNNKEQKSIEVNIYSKFD